MKINGKEWIPYEDKPIAEIGYWYDVHIRLWALLKLDAERNQIDEAIYCTSREDMVKERNWLSNYNSVPYRHL